MAKKQLTTKQKIKKYRNIQWGTFIGQYVCIATPYVVLGIVNWDKWFTNNPDGYKVGIGGAIALALVSIMTLLITNAKKEDMKINMYIPLILGWLMGATILHLLGSIILEISDLMYITTTGLAGAFGIDIVSNNAKEQKEHYTKALSVANDELDKEQARVEIVEEKKRKNIW